MLSVRFPRLKRWLSLLIVAGLFLSLAAGCGGGSKSPTQNAGQNQAEPKDQAVTLTGAGATFPYPLYSKWISEYNKLKPSVKIDYQSIGSGGGIKGITDRTVDFGASDAPLKNEQLQKAPGELFHIPTVLGAVVVTYNLPGVSESLKLSPEAVTGIWLGEIKKWNDPKIAADNPGVKLPEKDIVVVSRSDGSGTTAVFTDYLSKVSSAWKSQVGSGTSVKWPVGVSAKGNEGVSGQVKQTENSIGYVELAYAVQNKLAYASLKNRAGKWTVPSLESVTQAAAGSAKSMPADMRISITDAEGEGSYPIASYTYILVYKEQSDKIKAQALVNFLWWAIHDGEKMASDLLYSPLPTEVVKLAEAKLKAVTFQGQAVLNQ